jgi:cystathionine beta-synthase
VGKVYNDQWMMERGFMDVKTFRDIVSGRGRQRLITASPNDTVASIVEMMQKYDIENVPVMDGDQNLGSLSEQGLFNKVFSNPDLKNQPVSAVMEHPYPEVAFDTPVERLSSLMTRENGAVLSKDESGAWHIVTKYDVIKSLAK